MISESCLLQKTINACNVSQIRIEYQDARFGFILAFLVEVYRLHSEKKSPTGACLCLALSHEFAITIGEIGEVSLSFQRTSHIE